MRSTPCLNSQPTNKMKEKIIQHLGAKQTARVENKAATRGIDNIWDRAIERAKAELADANEQAIVERAAIRVQQIVGVIPRTQPVEEAVASVPAPTIEETTPETVEIPKSKKSKTRDSESEA